MEPVSAISSIVTLIGTAKTASKGLQRLKALGDAPIELNDLLEDVSSFKSLLQGIEDSPVLHNQRSPLLEQVLARANGKLLTIDKLVQYNLTKAGENKKVDRWQWVWKKQEIAEVRIQLGRVQNDLTTTLAIINLECTQRSTAATQLGRIGQEQTIRDLTANVKRQGYLLKAQHAMLEALFKIEELPSAQKVITEQFGDGVRTTRPGTSLSSENTTTDTQRDNSVDVRAGQRFETYTRATRLTNTCPLSCTCVCHRARYTTTCGLLSPILGLGSLLVKGTQLVGDSCTVAACRGSNALSFVVSYRMPKWFAQRIVYLWFTSSPNGSPAAIIRMPRVFDFGSETFMLLMNARRNNHHEEILRSKIAQGLISPYDETPCGDSVLVSILTPSGRGGVIDTFRWALEKGFCANQMWDTLVSSKGRNAVEMMFDWITDPRSGIRGRYSQPTSWSYLPQYMEILRNEDLEDLYEEKNFSRLHSIVCGIATDDLRRAAKAFPELIDRTDSRGLTPLWYAALHGDLDSVCTLLENGAGPGSVELPVLWAAVDSRDLDCVEALWRAGASLDAPTIECKIKSVHECFERYFDPGWYELRTTRAKVYSIDHFLVHAGFDYNSKTTLRGETFLMCCARKQEVERLDIVIGAGLMLDLELKNPKGWTALHYSVCLRIPGFPSLTLSSCSSFLPLIKAGACLDAQDDFARNILHLAVATWTRVEDVHDLYHAHNSCQIDLTSIRHDITDGSGFTPFSLLQERAGSNRKAHCFPNIDALCWMAVTVAEAVAQELEFIAIFRNLLCALQELQGVSEESRYPVITPVFSTPEEYQGLTEEWEYRPTPVSGEWPGEEASGVLRTERFLGFECIDGGPEAFSEGHESYMISNRQ